MLLNCRHQTRPPLRCCRWRVSCWWSISSPCRRRSRRPAACLPSTTRPDRYASRYVQSVHNYTHFTATRLSCRVGLRHDTTRHVTIRDAVLTCARKPTLASLIYRTEPTTRQGKTEKRKSKNGYAQKYRLTVLGIPKKKRRLRWEGVAEKKRVSLK